MDNMSKILSTIMVPNADALEIPSFCAVRTGLATSPPFGIIAFIMYPIITTGYKLDIFMFSFNGFKRYLHLSARI